MRFLLKLFLSIFFTRKSNVAVQVNPVVAQTMAQVLEGAPEDAAVHVVPQGGLGDLLRNAINSANAGGVYIAFIVPE